MSSRMESSVRFADLMNGLEDDTEETRLEHRGAYFLLHSNLRSKIFFIFVSFYTFLIVLTNAFPAFSRAIQALAKLGSDLYLEPSESGLSLKSFNKNKNAYAVFLFSNDFFSNNDFSALKEQTNNKVCRISMKCALAIFKGIQFLDKNYAKFEMWVDPSADTIVAQILHAYDMKRTIEINVLESRLPFKSKTDKNTLANTTVASSEYLMSLLSLLHSESELVICAGEDSFELKNFCTNNDTERLVKTSAVVPIQSLVRHQVAKTSEIGFSIKDFMAVLSFASQLQCDVSLYYDTPGQPLIVALEGDINYTTEFTLATFESPNEDGVEERKVDPERIRQSQAQSQRIPSQSRNSQIFVEPREEQSRNFESEITRDLRSFRPEPILEERASTNNVQEDVFVENDVMNIDQPGVGEFMEMARNDCASGAQSRDEGGVLQLQNEEPMDEHQQQELQNGEAMEEQQQDDFEMHDLPPTPERVNESDSLLTEPAIVPDEPTAPAAKRPRNDEFRRYLFSATVATQRASDCFMNESILAYESDHD